MNKLALAANGSPYILLGREGATLIHDEAYQPPAHAQTLADDLAAAVCRVESNMKQRIAARVPVLPNIDYMNVITSPDPFTPISIAIGNKFLAAPWPREQIEATLLHEIGHQHYRPVSEHFVPLRQIAHTLNRVAKLQKNFEARPEAVTASIIASFGDVQSLQAWLAYMRGVARKYHDLAGHFEGLSGASDEQIGAWLIQARQEHSDGKGLGQSPLAPYADLPPVPQDFATVFRYLAQAARGEVEPGPDIVRFVEPVRQLLTQYAPECERLQTVFAAIMRAEEHLCDDFAVLHADNPHAFSAVLERLQAHPTGREGTIYPLIEARQARCAELASRLAQATEPDTYCTWVFSLAEGRARRALDA